MRHMNTRVAVVTAVLALALVPMSGCAQEAGDTAGSATTDQASTATTDQATADTAASATSDEDTPNPYAGFQPSDGIDDDGRWSGVIATDYVTLPQDWDHIQIPSTEVVPTEDDVQQQVDNLLSQYTTRSADYDATIVDGDTVNIDYVGSVDGVEFDGGSTQGQGTEVTLGVTSYIDGFLPQLIGHKPGETFDIDVTFPDDYSNSDLAGKDAVFNITVNFIVRTEVPELTDEWVDATFGDLYDLHTVEDLRTRLADELRSEAIWNYVQTYLVQNSTATELPEGMLDYQKATLVSRYANYADQSGMGLGTMLSMAAGVNTVSDLIDANIANIQTDTLAYLAFQAVAEKVGIEVTDADVQSFLSGVASGQEDAFLAYYGEPFVRMNVLVEGAVEYLSDHVEVVD